MIERGLSIDSESLEKLPRFVEFHSSSLESIKKTGLGSSAALITALVGSLLEYCEVVKLDKHDDDEDHSLNERDLHLNFVHHVAQMCHCLAQKKIGSGFDVAAAVYGSQVYRRFSSDILATITENTNNQGIVEITPDILASLYSFDWDHEMCPIRLPVGIRLILGDVHSGTKSPHMASAVLEWKQRNSVESKRILGFFFFVWS